MVGLALLTFSPGRMGGSEEMVRGLTRALAEHGSRTYRVLAPPDALDVAAGLSVVAAGSPGSAPRVLAIARAAVSARLPSDLDVVHYPFTVPVPPARRPHIVTLHDVLHLDLPQLVPGAVRLFRRAAYDRAARRADRVVVPSAFVRDRAVALLGLDPERVRVIHHGVDPEAFRPGPVEREPFLLYPARPWPHKNHAALFEAFAALRRERPELELVLTGAGVETLDRPEGARALGRVPAERLADLYRRAAALVFPSRYEGFGQPVLEAMASGCPVVAARSGAVPEVAGDAAVLVDDDSASLVAGIREALDASAELSRRGLERARGFTWERVARLHDAVYAELE